MSNKPLSVRSLVLAYSYLWLLFPVMGELVTAQTAGKLSQRVLPCSHKAQVQFRPNYSASQPLWARTLRVRLTASPRVTGFQARGPDVTKIAGTALSQLQNATILLADAVLPATKQDVKKEIEANNIRLSKQQQVCCPPNPSPDSILG